MSDIPCALAGGNLQCKERDMTQHQRQADSPGNRPDEKKVPDERGKGEDGEIICRCKEVSKKTFPEMLKLMLRDLVFWKKTKGHK